MGGPWGELPIAPTWPCEAYGAEGLIIGANCFAGVPLGDRRCASRPECRALMSAERERIWAAVAADPVIAGALDGLVGPADILGGDLPIGLWCPECGELTTLTAGPDGSGSAFCRNEACRILMWDPTQTYARMLEEGVKEIEL